MDAQWDVFIAYSSKDRPLAEALAGALEPHVGVFLDSRCIRPGDDWDTSLRDALIAAPICVVLVSPSTDQAFFQRDEILRAIDLARKSPLEKVIVPIYLRGMRADSVQLPYGLKPKQGISLSSESYIPDVAEKILSLFTDVTDAESEARRFSTSIRLHLTKLEQDVEQLTQEQFRAIQMLRYTPRVLISGSAGSGKTLVAAEKASRLAAAGMRVLFLCHNPLLADYVRQLTAGTGVHVRDFESAHRVGPSEVVEFPYKTVVRGGVFQA